MIHGCNGHGIRSSEQFFNLYLSVLDRILPAANGTLYKAGFPLLTHIYQEYHIIFRECDEDGADNESGNDVRQNFGSENTP